MVLSSALGEPVANENHEGNHNRNKESMHVSFPTEPLREPLLLECNQNEIKRDNSSYNHYEAADDDDGEASENANRQQRRWQRRERSKNIPLVLIYTFITFAGRSMWSQSVLSAMVYLMTKNNNPEYVGFLTAIMGVSQLFASFPSGMLADMYRRDTMLKVGSFFGVVAMIMTVCATTFLESFASLGIALALWGIFYGITNTSISALFADSIFDGERSRYFTRRMMLTKLGSTAGPTASLIMFVVLGNNWTTTDCAAVMAFGQVVSLPGTIILCFLSDDHIVVEHHAESRELQIESTETLVPLSTEKIDDTKQKNGSETGPQGEHKKGFLCLPDHRVVPVLIVISDIIAGCAAGMSTRYYTIFFIDNLQLSPLIVSLIEILSPLGQMAIHQLAHIGGQKIGRCQIVVSFKWIGISLMIAMILAYRHQFHVSVVCILYLLRTSFVNATSNLTKSVIMDSVPRNERGKWSALESVNMFSWSGSAAFGGFLVGSKGVIFNFYVTAALQFVATFPLIVIFSRVKD